MAKTPRNSSASSSGSTPATAIATVFSCEILDERPGLLVFEVEGKRAYDLFKYESGGHRWQRVPPTEKRGRRHTSTVTVAVLPIRPVTDIRILDSEIEWKATVGSGPGGQHKNKTASCVVMKHIPTGLSVRIETGRSQTQNRELAYQVLASRVTEAHQNEQKVAHNGARRSQIGSGERGDKIRTIRTQDGIVTDHRSGKKIPYDRYRRGILDDLME